MPAAAPGAAAAVAALARVSADAATHPPPSKWQALWRAAADHCAPAELANLIHAWVAVAKLAPTAQIFDLVVGLHDQLFALHEDPDAQLAICKACELWFLPPLNSPASAHLATQLVPTLTLHALAKPEVVGRLYQVRHALGMLDLEDESADLLHQLLLRCFVAPVFLSKAQGRKFLGYAMTASKRLSQDAHQVFKTQLEHLARQRGAVSSVNDTIEAFADVYYEAWRLSASVVEPFVQDLVEASLLLQNQPLQKTVCKLLTAGFFSKKQERQVDLLLNKLYEPVIWRALSASNSKVRAQAGVILGNVFPLQAASLQDSSALVHKQFQALDALLRDPCPAVRTVAVEASARILTVFWETIPARRASDLLQLMVNELAHDKTSASVRAAVLRGLAYMTSEPLALPALKQALPHLRMAIHDKSPVVRLAAADLLQAVAKVRGWKYRDVVPVDHVLERLALDVDQPLVAASLVQLLLPSVYPVEAEGPDQLFRAKRLATTHPRAAKGFFTNLHHAVSIEKVCKLALLFASYLRAVLRMQSKASSGSIGEKKKAKKDEDGKEEEGPSDVAPCAEALLCLVASVWNKVGQQERYAEARQELANALSPDDVCLNLLDHAPTAAWRLAAFAPWAPVKCAKMEAMALGLLEREEEEGGGGGNEADSADLEGPLACLAAWSRLDAVVTMCQEAFSPSGGAAAAPASAAVAGTKKRKSSLSAFRASVLVQTLLRICPRPLVACTAVDTIASHASFARTAASLKLALINACINQPESLPASLGLESPAAGKYPVLVTALLADAARAGMMVPEDALSTLPESPAKPHLAMAMVAKQSEAVLSWWWERRQLQNDDDFMGGEETKAENLGLKLMQASREFFLGYCDRGGEGEGDPAKVCVMALKNANDARARKMLAALAPRVQPAPAEAAEVLRRWAGCADAAAAAQAWGLQ